MNVQKRTRTSKHVIQTLIASSWMAASTVYARLASAETVGLAQTQMSAPTGVSSVIQMRNVLMKKALSAVRASMVSKETERHVKT